VAGATAIALLTVGISAATQGRSLPSRSDPVVDLPAEGEVPSSPGVSDEEARAALAPFDPDRLRCEPAGCERWRFDAPHGGLSFAPFGELLAVHLDGRLHGIDPATGERRWAVPLSAPGTRGPAPRGVREQVLLAADDEHVAIARGGGELRLVDTHGRHRWIVTVPEGARIWQAQPAGEVVLTAGPVWRGSPPQPGDLLHAFDVTDGSLRWTRAVDGLAGPLQDLVVHDDEHGLVRLDPLTGEVQLRLGGNGWAQRFGAVYLVGSADDRAYPRLLDVATATNTIELSGHPTAHLTHGGWLYLATSGVNGAEPAADASVPGIEVLAVDDRGELRWRRTLELPWPAGPGDLAPWNLASVQLAVVDDHGGLSVHLDGDERPRVLDLEDGTDRPDLTAPRLPDDAWWSGAVAVAHRPDRLELHAPEGMVRIPVPSAWLVLDTPPVVGGPRGLLGIELAPDGSDREPG
jgi:outer membrane protein assembly factor BamB